MFKLFRFYIILMFISFSIIHIYINLNNNIIVIISSCSDNRKLNINISLIPFKVITLFCNKSINHIDSFEAGPMLDFIISIYNKIGIYKYIFIHDHVISWHYKESIYSRLWYLKSVKYLYKVKFGGVYCMNIKFGIKSRYEKLFNQTYEIDKYMRKFGYTTLSILPLFRKRIVFPCCTTFILDDSLIKLHPISLFINIRRGIKQYVWNNAHHNKLSAQYIEYLWNIIFGIKRISFPPDCNNTIIYV